MKNKENEEVMKKLTIEDFDGDWIAMCRYYGKFGGRKKQKNYRIAHLLPAHKKILNLALNTDLKQSQIAEATGVSQSYISNFLKEVNIKRIQKERLREKDFSKLFETLDVLMKKYLIDTLFLSAVIADDQDNIEEDFKL